MLAGVIIVGMLTWWWPGYHTWGALAGGLGVAFVLWVICKMVAGERTVPGHPVHVSLLGPAVVLTYHLAGAGLGKQPTHPTGLAGGLDVSMIFHLALLALGVMLTQSLLPRAAGHEAVLGACGLAMMAGAGAAAAWAWGREEFSDTALGLLGFAGIGVWLSALWGVGPAGVDKEAYRLRTRWLRLIFMGVGAITSAVLIVYCPGAAVLAAGVVGAVLLLAGIIFPGRRVFLILAGAVGLAVCGSAVAREIGLLSGPRTLADWIGRGEAAFAAGDLSARSSGLKILVETTGWAGAGWLVVGMVGCAGWLMGHARRGHLGDRPRAIVWTASAGLAGCAMLAPGGLFMPAAALAVAFTWGLLPAMLGRPGRQRSAYILLVLWVCLLLLLGLARKGGLATWATLSFGGGDSFMHAVSGFVLALVLAWLAGARRVRWGLLGVAVAALAGGAGELLQAVASRRSFELDDWLAHALGSAAAILPYLLCIGARMCESSEAVPRPKS